MNKIRLFFSVWRGIGVARLGAREDLLILQESWPGRCNLWYLELIVANEFECDDVRVAGDDSKLTLFDVESMVRDIVCGQVVEDVRLTAPAYGEVKAATLCPAHAAVVASQYSSPVWA